ncbi:MAG: hypothetical protein EXR75_01425 [Myxococcales bacterium]|nr:hypothetical protein [Myxococcales bacterium]
MSTVVVLAFVAAALLAINMGASGVAPSFSSVLGAGMASRKRILLAYGACVVLGAVLLGGRVTSTLGKSIAPAEAFTPTVTVAVLASIGVSLLMANLLKVPQSTSWVTVLSVVVVGVHHGSVNLHTLYARLLPAWVLLPLAGYAITFVALRTLYPLRAGNMALHEQLARRKQLVRVLAIGGGCYVAVANGSNNVANVVGPLSASGLVSASLGLLLVAPIFGLGAALVRGPADTMGKSIVPFGPVTAALTSVVVGSLLLFASTQGIPQSLVQLQAACVLAVSRVKEGSVELMPRAQLAKVLAVWLGAPIVAAGSTWLALKFFV